MSRIDWPMWLLMVGVLLALFVIGVGSHGVTLEQQRKCLERGGEFVDAGRSRHLCLKPGTVLH